MAQKASSAKLQLLNGNQNKKNTEELKRRAAAEDRLKMKSDAINAPPWLDALGKKTFAFIKTELMEVELISNPDIHAMALYCDWYSQYVLLNKQYKKMRSEHKKNYKAQKQRFDEGGPPPSIESELWGNPLSKQMDTCTKNIRSIGGDLGLSPAARAKLAIKLAEDSGGEDDGDY